MQKSTACPDSSDRQQSYICTAESRLKPPVQTLSYLQRAWTLGIWCQACKFQVQDLGMVKCLGSWEVASQAPPPSILAVKDVVAREAWQHSRAVRVNF